ncbi:AMP-dependent synthetase/ligase [Streptomyces uncialis]|uniref:Acyl-CoA synthetase n=1 Tax=Streptomyces uncialis TaxID=1048205 RepID=A0A1Q4VBW3_9ACTN|nr:AMP-dependent synthetase/ligase [Streptomyces uncialis]OKH95334.1 long-chain fatty acid--CoA ligase [Streptomyces uncialis]WTE14202.1 AMP-dependent synthetase/ligase [Streptomyces uncialis]
MREISVPRLVEPLAAGGLADEVFDRARREPDTVAMSLGGDRPGGVWVPLTAAGFRDEVMGVAKGLLAGGIRFGDRVALMSRTRYEWTLFAFALWTVGARVVPVYPTSSTDQVRWILRDTQVSAVVVEDEGHAMTVAAVCDGLPLFSRIWQLDAGCVEQLVAEGAQVPDEEVHRCRAAVRPEQIAAIVHTSGTTSPQPRGCLLTHRNLAYGTDTLVGGWGEVLTAEDGDRSLLTFLPMAHVCGLMIAVAAVRRGVRLAHQPDMRPGALLPSLASFRPSCVIAVPHVFERIFRQARRRAELGGKAAVFDRAVSVAVRYAEAVERERHGEGTGPGAGLRMQHALYDHTVYARIRAVFGGRARCAVSGGSTLRRRLGLFFAGAGITVYDGYGLTETSGGCAAQPPGAVKFGTVGKPLPGDSLHIAADGEIWVRGDNVFLGYLNDVRASRTALRGGWFGTGDLGFLDDDGYLVITGRKNDLIVTSTGRTVAPLALEERVRDDPLVSQCVVVGDDQPCLAALITLDPAAVAHWRKLTGQGGGDGEDTALRAMVQRAVVRANSGVSPAESIRAFHILPAEFTVGGGLLTPSFKVRRGAVVEAFAAEIEAMYAAPRPSGGSASLV